MKQRIKWFILGFFVLFVMANLVVIKMFSVSEIPLERAKTFDPDLRTDYCEEINSVKPEIIILGDSSISHLDRETISSLLGKETLIFPSPGTGSAYWYLFIRNQLFLSNHYPQYFVMFFRDSTLTVPDYRVNGEYYLRLEEIASYWDEDVFHLALNYNKPQIIQWMEKYIPIFSYRTDIYSQLINWSRSLIPKLVVNTTEDEINAAYERIFEREQINDLLWEKMLLNRDSLLYASNSLHFKEEVDESFLPAMIRDLKMMNIQPVFIRVKYQSHARGESDNPALRTYLYDLRTYLEGEEVIYMDMSDERELTESMYKDNFHIQSSSGKKATKIVAEIIYELIN